MSEYAQGASEPFTGTYPKSPSILDQLGASRSGLAQPVQRPTAVSMIRTNAELQHEQAKRLAEIAGRLEKFAQDLLGPQPSDRPQMNPIAPDKASAIDDLARASTQIEYTIGRIQGTLGRLGA